MPENWHGALIISEYSADNTFVLSGSSAYPVGSYFYFRQNGNGVITFSPPAGQFIFSLNNANKTPGLYGMVTVVKTASTE